MAASHPLPLKLKLHVSTLRTEHGTWSGQVTYHITVPASRLAPVLGTVPRAETGSLEVLVVRVGEVKDDQRSPAMQERETIDIPAAPPIK